MVYIKQSFLKRVNDCHFKEYIEVTKEKVQGYEDLGSGAGFKTVHGYVP